MRCNKPGGTVLLCCCRYAAAAGAGGRRCPSFPPPSFLAAAAVAGMRGPLPAAVALAIAVAWAVYLVPRGGQRDNEDAALPLLPSPLDAATIAEAPRRLATALTFVSCCHT